MTFTAKELQKVLNAHATLKSSDGMTFEVRVLDARQVFGRIDYLVSPVTGYGTQWVSADRVALDTAEAVR